MLSNGIESFKSSFVNDKNDLTSTNINQLKGGFGTGIFGQKININLFTGFGSAIEPFENEGLSSYMDAQKAAYLKDHPEPAQDSPALLSLAGGPHAQWERDLMKSQKQSQTDYFKSHPDVKVQYDEYTKKQREKVLKEGVKC